MAVQNNSFQSCVLNALIKGWSTDTSSFLNPHVYTCVRKIRHMKSYCSLTHIQKEEKQQDNKMNSVQTRINYQKGRQAVTLVYTGWCLRVISLALWARHGAATSLTIALRGGSDSEPSLWRWGNRGTESQPRFSSCEGEGLGRCLGPFQILHFFGYQIFF